jgi:MYXO-CTERM domain-containing protein
VDDEGAPRLERIVPVALLAVGVVGLFAVGRKRRKG